MESEDIPLKTPTYIIIGMIPWFNLGLYCVFFKAYSIDTSQIIFNQLMFHNETYRIKLVISGLYELAY